MSQASPPSSRMGYTLVELLVTLVIGASLVSLLLVALSSATDRATETRGRLRTHEEARTALSLLRNDLAKATRLNEALLPPARGSNEIRPSPCDEIGFYLHLPLSTQPHSPAPTGTLCFAHYYTDIRHELPGNKGRLTRILYRKVYNSAIVREWLENGIRPDIACSPTPDIDSPIAFDVAGFLARPASSDSAPNQLIIRLDILPCDLASDRKSPADWSQTNTTEPGVERFQTRIPLPSSRP